jgi:two-component system, NarL family, sensor histidine kinase DegS
MVAKKIVDEILGKVVEAVDQSKDELFQIGEYSRQEFDELVQELKDIKIEVHSVKTEGDQVEVDALTARNRLSIVSNHFNDFSEKEIRDAYERAHELQMKLSIIRQKEKQLQERSSEIERRIHGIQDTIERAEHVVGQVSIVLNYLDSDFKQVGEILADAKQKQDFGLKIIEAQEEERRKLSREIHDGPAQMLANVMMRSQLIERVFREQGADEGFNEIQELRKTVGSALAEVRRIIFDLRPMALDDLGLIPTLKKYLGTVEEYNGVTRINFVHVGSEARFPLNVEVAIFRLIQEGVQNALKHSEAEEIIVKLEITCGQCVVVIKDNGKGFDKSNKKDKSFGLIGMRERVEILKGKLTIDSKLGVGTTIMILVPLNKSV